MVGPAIANERWDRLISEHRAAGGSRLERRALPRPGIGAVVLLVWTAVLAVLFGALLIEHGLSQLRWAYLYRERSGEGIGFFQVVAYAVPGGLLCLVATAELLVAARGVGGRVRVLLLVLAAAVVAGLVVAAGVATWVESQSGCIGPCG